MPDLEKFAAQHSMRILSIADLIEYRLQQESLVVRQATAPLTPTLPGVTAAESVLHKVAQFPREPFLQWDRKAHLVAPVGDRGRQNIGIGTP